MEESKLAVGTYGYIDNLKQTEKKSAIIYAVFTVLLFAVPPLFLKTTFSAFTVAAVVMLIPAFQSFKQYMNLKDFKSCDREEYDKIAEIVKGKLWMVLLSDLVLSSESGDMMLNMAIICNNNIYGYAPAQAKSVENIEALLTNILAEGDISHKKPVVHNSFEEFEEMVMMLAANEPSATQDVGRIYHQIQSYCK
ncbi:hypothetical protein [Frisingicoccus sp.]|uniref:hypothetical protein n=1 Tax=Frisingicoccus sp. TaxID=1918627 RepID=UPI0038641397